jgi:hypothetical protein
LPRHFWSRLAGCNQYRPRRAFTFPASSITKFEQHVQRKSEKRQMTLLTKNTDQMRAEIWRAAWADAAQAAAWADAWADAAAAAEAAEAARADAAAAAEAAENQAQRKSILRLIQEA